MSSSTQWFTCPDKRDGRASMTSSPGTHRANLRALLAAIKNSPIVARLTAGLWPGRDWASVRRSPDVDAFVLAWIASHARRPVRRRDFFM
jgi:hypothetical protein